MHASKKITYLTDHKVRQILHFDLVYHPYKNLYTYQLLLTDYVARMKFCVEMLPKINSGEILFKALLITDESYFYLQGDINEQNLHY